MAQAIYREGSKLVTAGHNPMAIKRGIDKDVSQVVEGLKSQSKKTKDQMEIAPVGTVSANGDSTIGSMIAEAMEKVGKEGVITVEEAKSMESSRSANKSTIRNPTTTGRSCKRGSPSWWAAWPCSGASTS